MYTVSQVARALDLSGTTVRNYTTAYADFLSPAANPGPGQPRLYTDEDTAVLATVAALRSRQATADQVRAALEEGQRLEPVRPPVEDSHAPAAEDDQPDQSAAGQARAAATETALTLYRDRVTALETRADQLADRLIEAEARAAAAERELEILRELHAADQAGNPKPLTFWQWVQSRRR